MNRLSGIGSIFAAPGAYLGRFGLMTLMNLVTLLCSVPLVLVGFIAAGVAHQILLAPLGIVLLVGILPNPAAAGLQYCARLRALDDPLAFSDLRDGLRQFWRPAVPLFAVGIIALVIIVANVGFYGSMGSPFAHVLAFGWLYILAMWIGVQFYVYPLLLVVDNPSVWRIYRNAAILVITRPIPTLTVGLVWLAWLAVASIGGIIIFAGLVVAALLQQGAFVRILPTVRQAE